MIDIADIAADPRHFPHAINFETGLLDFLETSPDRLRASDFLDGRSDFSTGPGGSVPIDRIDPDQASALLPDRFIFHTAFCGSTLFTRLLDVVTHPYDERPGRERYAAPAPPDFGTYRTFCGT